MTEPIRTDAQPTGPDRELAERIMRMYSRKSGWSGEIAELIAQHHAAERAELGQERVVWEQRELQLLSELNDIATALALPSGRLTVDIILNAVAAERAELETLRQGHDFIQRILESVEDLEPAGAIEAGVSMLAFKYEAECERIARLEHELAEAMIILKGLSIGAKWEIAPAIMEEINKLCESYEARDALEGKR